MTTPIIHVAEGRRVALPPELDKPRVLQRLLRAGETPRGNAFRLKRGGLYAGQLVGFVDVGIVQIQIVPKVSDGPSDFADATTLVRLFAHAGLPFKATVSSGRAERHQQPVLEPIIRHVASEMHRLLIGGIPRRYFEKTGLSSTIRGRIDIARLARRRPGLEHLVPIRFAPLQKDNDLNRTLHALLERLATLARSAKTLSVIRRCLHFLGGTSSVPLTPALVEGIHLSRIEHEWRQIVSFAQLIAAGHSPDATRAGTIPGFALLLSLHDLFERILRHILGRELRAGPLALDRGGSSIPLLRQTDGTETLRLRPDFLFRNRNGDVCLVGDAKWKRLNTEQANLGLVVGDVYQILTYMRRFQARNGVLFFPARQALDQAVREHRFDVLPQGGTLHIVEADMAQIITPVHERRRLAAQHVARCVTALSRVRES